jgi:hypothetical protein
MTAKEKHLADALRILIALGMPSAQQNERSAVSLLALLNLQPSSKWSQCTNPLIGITPIMDWARAHYGKEYAPNTRETFRRRTMHQMMDAGIARCNPDDPQRPVNSPQTVYQISLQVLESLKLYGTEQWERSLKAYLGTSKTLVEQYAAARDQHQVPVTLAKGKRMQLTAGDHSELIKAIVEDFRPRLALGSALVYAGDTGAKWGYFDEKLLRGLGVVVDSHGKMPDVILHFKERNWLLLVEAVTSHGPVDGKRHGELAKLFAESTAALVYVTAFPNRRIMGRHLGEIAWETEVWVANAPSHLIHFNGLRFLGPYGGEQR